MIDVVYTFTYNRKSWNTQLRYSLRSVEKHLTGVRKIHVIGFRCNMPGVNFIEHHDNFSASRNISSKLLAIANNPDVSPRFLYMADDHYLLKDTTADQYPFYVNGTLEEIYRTQNNAYRAMIKNTLRVLTERNFPALNYNVHTPVLYEKRKLLELGGYFDMENPLGYVMKSLYLNVFPPDKTASLKDCKIRSNFDPGEIMKRIEGRDCWSTGKEWECPNIEIVLKTLYPNKSKWE